jgi:hypothetical protein
MNPATIIREAQADGVRLALSPAGTIKVTGNKAALERWLPVIRERKAEIIAALKVGAGDTARAGVTAAEPFEPVNTPPSAPLTPYEEKMIRRWLALIGETDPAMITAVIEQCLNDADAKAYYLERAASTYT